MALDWCTRPAQVLAKLQKAGPARLELEAAMVVNPPQRLALLAALERARAARGLIDEALLERGEELATQLSQAAEKSRWYGLFSQMGIAPGGAANGTSHSLFASTYDWNPSSTANRSGGAGWPAAPLSA